MLLSYELNFYTIIRIHTCKQNKMIISSNFAVLMLQIYTHKKRHYDFKCQRSVRMRSIPPKIVHLVNRNRNFSFLVCVSIVKQYIH